MAPKFTYSDTTTQDRSVINEFDLMSWQETPFLKLISGGTSETPSLSNLPTTCDAMKYEWLEDEDPRYQTTLGAAIAGTGDATITIASGFVANVVEGHILLIESEQLLVGVSTGANPVAVTRGYGGTTAATHSNATAVYIIGRVHKEGADAPEDMIAYPTMPFNYVQEITATIKLSELEQVNNRYGVDDAVEYETSRRTRQLFVMAERQCFYGVRVAGSSSVPSAFGGVETFIPTGNIGDAASGALTGDMLLDQIQKCYDQGGLMAVPKTIVCNSYVRRKITKIFAAYNATTYREANDRRGGVKVDRITTDFGDLDILVTPWIAPEKLFVVHENKIHIGPMGAKSFKREMLAKTGTTDKWMISGAYTLAVRNSKFHCGVKNISLSA